MEFFKFVLRRKMVLIAFLMLIMVLLVTALAPVIAPPTQNAANLRARGADVSPGEDGNLSRPAGRERLGRARSSRRWTERFRTRRS